LQPSPLLLVMVLFSPYMVTTLARFSEEPGKAQRVT
jgi:hypothetical protein